MRVERSFVTMTRSVASDVEVVAFGDLHGRLDLFDALLGVARGLPRVRPLREAVTLGDLVDRGPDSLGVVARAEGIGAELRAASVAHLAGNHEGMLQVALDEGLPEDVRRRGDEARVENGGRALERQAVAETGIADGRDALRTRLGRHLAGLRPHHRSGDVLFVHAGLHPRLEPGAFLAAPFAGLYGRRVVDPDLHWAWIGKPFLNHRPGTAGHHGLFVVHGHSVRGASDDASDRWAAEHSRLNLDGGSDATGRARMAVLRGDVAEVYEAVA